jgi:hypothetical protein
MLFFNFYRQLWQQARFWAVVLTVFIAVQLFFVYKQIDSFPFHNYGMYSGKAGLAYDATVFRLQINGRDFSPEQQMPMLSQSVLYSNLHFFTAIKQTGAAREANLRAVIAGRLNTFVAAENLPNYLPFFERQLCNPTTAEPAKMQAWLSRYLANFTAEKIDNIHVWQIHIQRQEPTFVAVDSFLLL